MKHCRPVFKFSSTHGRRLLPCQTECRENVLAAQGHKEATLKREIKALEVGLQLHSCALTHVLSTWGPLVLTQVKRCLLLTLTPDDDGERYGGAASATREPGQN